MLSRAAATVMTTSPAGYTRPSIPIRTHGRAADIGGARGAVVVVPTGPGRTGGFACSATGRSTRSISVLAGIASLLFGALANAQHTPLWQASATQVSTTSDFLALRFNHELLAQLGLRVQAAAADERGASDSIAPDHVSVALTRRGDVSAQLRGASLQSWQGGEFASAPDAGFVLVDRAGHRVFDYRPFTLRTRRGTTALDVVGVDGYADLYADALMAVPVADGHRVQLLSLDLRLGESAARRTRRGADPAIAVARDGRRPRARP